MTIRLSLLDGVCSRSFGWLVDRDAANKITNNQTTLICWSFKFLESFLWKRRKNSIQFVRIIVSWFGCWCPLLSPFCHEMEYFQFPNFSWIILLKNMNFAFNWCEIGVNMMTGDPRSASNSHPCWVVSIVISFVFGFFISFTHFRFRIRFRNDHIKRMSWGWWVGIEYVFPN